MKNVRVYILVICSICLLAPVTFEFLLKRKLPEPILISGYEFGTNGLIQILGNIVLVLIMEYWFREYIEAQKLSDKSFN